MGGALLSDYLCRMLKRCAVVLCLLSAQACGGSGKHKPDGDGNPEAGPGAQNGGGGALDAGLDAAGPDSPEAGSDPDAGAEGGVTPPDEADLRLFDPFLPMPRIDITVTPAAEEGLRNTPTEYAPATFTFTDGQGSVGPLDVNVRRKGYAGSVRSFDEKFAFKVDINAVDKDQKFFGLKELNLNNMVQDPSALHEWASYALFGSQGVPAPRVGYVRVFVNGEQFGVYLAVEATDDKAYLKRSFPSTLVMYEGEFSQDLIVGTEDGLDEDAGDDPERTALKALTQAIADAPADQFYTQVAPYLHFPEVLAEMATEVVVGHWDGYATTRNNYFIHFDEERRASLLPWGTDQTFRREPPYFGGEGLLLQRCVADPACKADYVKALGKVGMAAKTFVDTRSTEVMELANKLADAFATDPRVEYAAAEVPNSAADMLAYLSKRSADVSALLTCLADPNADKDQDDHICVDDCDETNAARYVGAVEQCGNEVDEDCTGLLDDDPCPACASDDSLGSTYLFCRTEADYATAKTECGNRGATLVKLESAAQATALTMRAKDYLGTEQGYWLGLDDLTTEGEWVWSDASSLGTANAVSNVFDCDTAQTGDHYCNWGDEQPNDDGGEDCVSVRASGTWNDLSCSYAFPFICQVP